MKPAAGERLFIIDASIFIFRYYFSMPPNWQANNGRPTETVYGYAQWLEKFLRQEQPTHVVACFDESLGSCFRNEIYPDYKVSRVLPDDDLAFQLLACKKVTEYFGVPCFASDRFEADDLIGSFAKLSDDAGVPCAILTRDKDLAQLLFSEKIHLWDYPDVAPFCAADLQAKLHISPEQVADYLALVGDVGDDIPGVPGVGPKTAAALLMHMHNWANIRENMAAIHRLPIRGAKSLQAKIEAHWQQVDMAVLLTRIALDAHPASWCDTQRKEIAYDALCELSEGLGFPSSFIKKVEKLR